MSRVKRFFGLNNVTDRLRMGLAWLERADNVHVTDTGALVKRDGYMRLETGVFAGAYNTLDYSRAYVVDGLSIKAISPSGSLFTIVSGLASTAPMYWTEANGSVYYNNGVDSGVIAPDNTWTPWRWTPAEAPTLALTAGSLQAGTYQVRCVTVLDDGRVTGASDAAVINVPADGTYGIAISKISQYGAKTQVYIAPANSTSFQLAATIAGAAMTWDDSADALGVYLPFEFLDPMPLGTTDVEFWAGRAYTIQYLPTEDVSVVWYSQPLGYHLFNPSSDYFMVKGHAYSLSSVDEALLIFTSKQILAWDTKALRELAPYGTVPGQFHSRDADGKTLIFWTERGVCSALPFKNLTESQVSLAPGAQACGAVIRSGGQRRYVVSLRKGGSAFNPFS